MIVFIGDDCETETERRGDTPFLEWCRLRLRGLVCGGAGWRTCARIRSTISSHPKVNLFDQTRWTLGRGRGDTGDVRSHQIICALRVRRVVASRWVCAFQTSREPERQGGSDGTFVFLYPLLYDVA